MASCIIEGPTYFGEDRRGSILPGSQLAGKTPGTGSINPGQEEPVASWAWRHPHLNFDRYEPRPIWDNWNERWQL